MNQASRASAPGKVILSGEHSVVYGYPAIAASVGARIYVTVELKDTKTVRITSDGYFSPITYNKQDLKAIREGKLFSELDGIAKLVDEVLLKKPEFDFSGMDISIESEIPMGAGLGSSASVCVATVSALAELFDLELDTEGISKIAFEGEKVIHGTPSGIDNSTSAFGGLIKYEGGNFEHFKIHDEFPLIIANSKIPRSTKVLVGKVRSLYERYPSVLEGVFKSMGDLSLKMLDALLSSDLVAVGDLMNINQGLLNSIGVGHPLLDKYIETARENGALGAKLTGAGGGGCIIAVAEDNRKAEKIATALRDIGAEVIQTNISPNGVRQEKLR